MEAVPFDRSALKVNQAILITTIVAMYFVGLFRSGAAFVLPALAVMMLAAVASPQTNLPRQLYLHVLKPAGWVRARVRVEDPAPHRFAQLLGGVFLTLASIFVFVGEIGRAHV